MHAPREPHLALVKRILRYVKGMLSSWLHISTALVQSLTAYSDADWIGCLDLSYGPPWAHYLGGYQDRLLGGPLGLLSLCHTAPDGVRRKDYGGGVLE
jgi:hypothetical protein